MSYKKEIKKTMEEKGIPDNRLDISTLKYFWQASPLSRSSDSNIPKFLRSIKVLKNFSDLELKTLANFMHVRSYKSKEVIFNQEDTGVGFYFILNGQVEIWAKSYRLGKNNELLEDEDQVSVSEINHIATLERGDHFGELALLQEKSARTASAIAKESCMLLGIFKPDMSELIDSYPVVGAKLLQSISIILANRLSSVTNEMKVLKYKLYQIDNYEPKNNYQK